MAVTGDESEAPHHSAAGDEENDKEATGREPLDSDTSFSAESVPADGEDEGVAVSSGNESTGTSNGSTVGDSATGCEKDRQTTACKINCLKNGNQCLKVAAEMGSANSSDVSSSIATSSQTNNSNDTKPSCKKNKAKDTNAKISVKSNASSGSIAATVETSSGPETSLEKDSSIEPVDSSSGTRREDSKAKSNDGSNGPDQNTSSASHENGDFEDNDQSEWTVSEDHRVRGMKESTDNLSWAEIGKSLKRGKAEVKARWKAIKDQQLQDYATDSDTGADTKGDHGASQSADDGAKEGKLVTPAKGTRSEALIKQTKEHRNQRVAQEDKGVKLRASKAQCNNDILSGSETSSEPLCVTDERRREKRYLYDHVYKTLYPTKVEVRENEHLTERDRAMLATIAGMHTTNKLLETKANFMNATGADVPIAVLRDWYEGEWAAKREHPNAGQQEDSAERVEKWIDSVSMGGED